MKNKIIYKLAEIYYTRDNVEKSMWLEEPMQICDRVLQELNISRREYRLDPLSPFNKIHSALCKVRETQRDLEVYEYCVWHWLESAGY